MTSTLKCANFVLSPSPCGSSRCPSPNHLQRLIHPRVKLDYRTEDSVNQTLSTTDGIIDPAHYSYNIKNSSRLECKRTSPQPKHWSCATPTESVHVNWLWIPFTAKHFKTIMIDSFNIDHSIEYLNNYRSNMSPYECPHMFSHIRDNS